MIYINNEKVDIKHFPDGTQMLFNSGMDPVVYNCDSICGVRSMTFRWRYENDEEMVTLMYLLKHYRDVIPVQYKQNLIYRLVIDYLPNARMDRTKANDEVFTLKYFCEFINSLNFDEVEVLDPHSDVGVALLHNVVVKSPENYIKEAIDDIEGVGIDGGEKYGGKSIIFFPDEGAMKRYKDLKVFGERRIIYGKKVRDWRSGKILGLTIHTQDGGDIKEFGNKPLKGEVVIMIDDIISYGGTLAHSADELKELGASAIYAYASHTENSVLNEEKGTFIKRLDSGVVDELFTTGSIYNGTHPKITVLENE